MATFAKTSFSAASYASFRPQYSPTLLEKLMSYHKGPTRLAIDVGCGTGISTRPLAACFDRVIGTDPGAGMLETASKSDDVNGDKISYAQGFAEDLGYLESEKGVKPGEVDMVVSGQAVHWFQHDKWFAEMHRVLRKGGTLAYWGYSDPGFKGHPKATEILMRYAYSDDPKEGLGRFWPKGRETVRNLNRSVVPPDSLFEDIQRTEFLVGGGNQAGGSSSSNSIMVPKRVTMLGMASYMSTWSSYQEWKIQNPGTKSKILEMLKEGPPEEKKIVPEGESEDFIDRAVSEICTTLGWGLNQEVEVQFAASIVCARRRA